MTITVEDRPQQLRELLWIREARGLMPAEDDLPPLLADTPSPATNDVDDATHAAWERAWPHIWREAAAHAGQEADPRTFDQLQQTPGGSPERAALLRDLVGPPWDDDFGRDIFDDPSYVDWERGSMATFIASRPHAMQNSPERRDLDALIKAWRAGLTKVVTVPCQGQWQRKLGPHSLLVSDATRDDSDAYRQALNSFI